MMSQKEREYLKELARVNKKELNLSDALRALARVGGRRAICNSPLPIVAVTILSSSLGNGGFYTKVDLTASN